MANKVDKKPSLIIFFLLLISLSVILVSAYIFLKPILIEEYCRRQAEQIVGRDNWGSKYFDTTKEEQTLLGANGKITWGFREQLKCERNLKLPF